MPLGRLGSAILILWALLLLAAPAAATAPPAELRGGADGGLVDGGFADAGPDGGVDAGPASDAGDFRPAPDDISCAAGGGAGLAPALGVFAAALVLRRRRRCGRRA